MVFLITNLKHSALTLMCKVAHCFHSANIATWSQELNWSHLIEPATNSGKHERQIASDVDIQINLK